MPRGSRETPSRRDRRLRSEAGDPCRLNESPLRALFRLALPLLGVGALNVATMLGDRFWIGGLGREALAGLAGAHAVWLLALTLILGLSLGTLANVARGRGAADEREAARSAGAGLTLALLLGLVLALTAWPLACAAQLLVAPSLNLALVPHSAATHYLAIVLAGALFQAPLMAGLFALQGAGEGRAALAAGSIYPLLNLVLTPLLLAFGLGLAGAALATVLANACALAAVLVLARHHLGIQRADLRLTRERLGAILEVGLPRSLEHLLRNGAGLVLVTILAPFGSGVLAGYAAALALLLLLIHPGLALGQASAACVAQALGAGRPERAWASAWWAAGSYALFLGLAGLILHAHAPALVSVFDASPRTVQAGSALLRTLAPALPLLGVGLILGKAFAGARRADLALRATAAAHLGVQLPLVWVLAQVWGVEGAFFGMATAYVVHGLLAAILFARAFQPTRLPHPARTAS